MDQTPVDTICFHILCLIFIRLGTSVDHNKTKNRLYEPGSYITVKVTGQG